MGLFYGKFVMERALLASHPNLNEYIEQIGKELSSYNFL